MLYQEQTLRRLDECASHAITQKPLLQLHDRVWLPRGAGLALPTATEEALTNDSLGASSFDIPADLLRQIASVGRGVLAAAF